MKASLKGQKKVCFRVALASGECLIHTPWGGQPGLVGEPPGPHCEQGAALPKVPSEAMPQGDSRALRSVSLCPTEESAWPVSSPEKKGSTVVLRGEVLWA